MSEYRTRGVQQGRRVVFRFVVLLYSVTFWNASIKNALKKEINTKEYNVLFFYFIDYVP